MLAINTRTRVETKAQTEAKLPIERFVLFVNNSSAIVVPL